MIKSCQLLSSKAASLGPLETMRVSIKLMDRRVLQQLPDILGNDRNVVDRFKPTTHVLNTGLSRWLRYGRNVFGSDRDFRLATPERQAEVRRLTL
jgi:hypothetical protein